MMRVSLQMAGAFLVVPRDSHFTLGNNRATQAAPTYSMFLALSFISVALCFLLQPVHFLLPLLLSHPFESLDILSSNISHLQA